MEHLLCREWIAARHTSARLADLAPSDFFLFGYVKHRLQGIIFPSGEELLAGICEVLREIPLETLAHVFDHWMERPDWVSQNTGGYGP
jgi:hypothetical protein